MTVTTTAPPPAVRTEGLTRTFGSFTAVDSLDLEIPAGMLAYAFIKPSCRKTITKSVISVLMK